MTALAKPRRPFAPSSPPRLGKARPADEQSERRRRLARERMRRYRQRKRLGERVLRGGLRVDATALAVLVHRGLIPAGAVERDSDLLDAFAELHDRLAEAERVTPSVTGDPPAQVILCIDVTDSRDSDA